MAVKPIIDISVKSQEFERFLELYHGYSADVEAQPDKWNRVNEAMSGAGSALRKGAVDGKDALALASTQAGILSEEIQKSTKAQTSFVSVLGLSEKSFSSLAKTGARAAEGIGKAFSGAARGSIAEMGTGIAGVAEGAVSALGPVGLAIGAITAAVGGAALATKALADAAVTRQRSAFSLGLSPGQQASFDVNAQQFLGPGALNAAANAQSSYGSAGALATLGIGFDQARKMSASDLAFEMLKNATKAAQASPDVPLENIPAVQQYMALGGQLGDVRNAQRLGLKALNDAQYDANVKATRLDLDQDAVARAAHLKKSTEALGVQAQSAAINTIFAPPQKLHDKVNDAGNQARAAFNHAVGSVSVSFHKLVTDVEHRVDPALHALQAGAHAAADAFKSFVDSVWHGITTPFVAGADAAAIDIAKKRGLYVHDADTGKPLDDKAYAKATAAIMDVAKSKGVDPVLALADSLQESNLNPTLHYQDHYANGDPAGTSVGLYSLMDKGGEGTGMTVPARQDPRKNASVALSEFAAVMHSTKAQLRARERALGVGEWSGDVTKLTPGQIAALAERPAAPEDYAKTVDAFYQAIMKAQRAAPKRPQPAPRPMHVSVRNSTSARVAISANAIAAG